MDADEKRALDSLRKEHADLQKRHNEAQASLEKLNRVHAGVLSILKMRGTMTKDEYNRIYAEAKFNLPPMR